MIKPTSSYTLVKLLDDELIAVAENGPLMVFDQELNLVNRCNGANRQPRCLDGTDKFVSFADSDGQVRVYARHGQRELMVV